MKLCRFEPIEAATKHPGRTQREAHVESRAGIVEGDAIFEISGELWGRRERSGRDWSLNRVKLLPPSWPTKIVCVGKNYADHAAEMGGVPPKQPLIFLKPPSSIIAPGDAIVLPASSQHVDYEGELAVVMGKRCSRPGAGEDVGAYIAGYTCLNDVTARDFQKLDVQFTRAKGFDTFCPFGPVLETERPAGDVAVETFLNGARKQSGRFADMIFGVDVVVRWIANVMTLEPGDVIATGTPAGVGPLAGGDVVEVRIAGIGALRNAVATQQ